MKKLLLSLGLIFTMVLDAQVLEVPTLKSKGIKGDVVKVELNQYEYVKDKGLILTQSDVESYDEKGRLIGIDRDVHSTKLRYRYSYKLSKKGLLEQEKIVNAANNQTVRTTDYSYKKKLLHSTTQVQGTVTAVKKYAYNPKGHLVKMEMLENGTLIGEEIYRVDEQGRRIRLSQKLPSDEVARTISTYTYKTEGNQEIKTEIRRVNGVKYEIISFKDLNKDRNTKEVTKNLDDNKSGYNQLYFIDDANGSWVKGEIIDNQFGRSRLVLRRITYRDGSATGRKEMTFQDSRARYFRQYSKFQVAFNGRIVETSAAESLVGTKDRLTYSNVDSAMILLKGYDENSYQTTWHEAEVVSNGANDVLWLGKDKGIDVYMKGKRLLSDGYSPLSSRNIGNTTIAHIKGKVNKTFIAKNYNAPDRLGKLSRPDWSEEHYYWGKATDSTYVLTGYGKSISIGAQVEDKSGNKLIKTTLGNDWYVLPDFRNAFDNGNEGDVFRVIHLKEPLNDIKKHQLFDADFSSFSHDNLKEGKYRLKSADGLRVTTIASRTDRTSDGQLINYFPLTDQYLEMENYYTLPEDKDILDQPVSVLLSGSANAYYLYNERKSIDFYSSGKRIVKFNFNAHRLIKDSQQYGAMLYDSISTANYGINYDLAESNRMGPMKEMPYNSYGMYLLKLDAGRWVIFEKGSKIGNYDYTAVENGTAYYFFKDSQNKVRGYLFEGYKDAKTGEFTTSKYVFGKEALELSEKLGINPLKSKAGSGK